MRSLPKDIESKVNEKLHTRANSSEISSRIWISRKTTPFLTDDFIERQTVKSGNITDASVTVAHPKFGFKNTRIFISYIENGIARVVLANHKSEMKDHEWLDTGFSEPATSVSVAFDGVMPKNTDGNVEFITEEYPWIFWSDPSGALYGRKMNDPNRIILAEENCTDVSAVRAMWSEGGSFDFGLIVFFILSGQLYYRQLIDGEWKDAEFVNFGPSGENWIDVAATRTWDYRVVVQVRSGAGNVYEFYTQFMGIGKQSTEYVELSDISVKGELIPIIYSNYKHKDEYVELSEIRVGALYGGLYSIYQPNIRWIRNISDGSGDFGKIVVVTTDVHINPDSLKENRVRFSLTDQRGQTYQPYDIYTNDGYNIHMIFINLNSAFGVLDFKYSPGDLKTMYGLEVVELVDSFLPVGLVPPMIPPPEVVRIWNDGSDGTKVVIEFNKELFGEVEGNESYFTVTIEEPDVVPDGTMYTKDRVVTEVHRYEDTNDTIVIHFQNGNQTSIQNAVGPVNISYGGGTLAGQTDIVYSFSIDFTPVGLERKWNPHDPEHVELSEIDIRGDLIRIYYTEYKHSDEYVELSDITVKGALISIDDI